VPIVVAAAVARSHPAAARAKAEAKATARVKVKAKVKARAREVPARVARETRGTEATKGAVTPTDRPTTGVGEAAVVAATVVGVSPNPSRWVRFWPRAMSNSTRRT
jgi:hypothetical protein